MDNPRMESGNNPAIGTPYPQIHRGPLCNPTVISDQLNPVFDLRYRWMSPGRFRCPAGSDGYLSPCAQIKTRGIEYPGFDVFDMHPTSAGLKNCLPFLTQQSQAAQTQKHHCGRFRSYNQTIIPSPVYITVGRRFVIDVNLNLTKGISYFVTDKT